MLRVELVLAGLGALAASGPGKPPETQLPWVQAEAGLFLLPERTCFCQTVAYLA